MSDNMVHARWKFELLILIPRKKFVITSIDSERFICVCACVCTYFVIALTDPEGILCRTPRVLAGSEGFEGPIDSNALQSAATWVSILLFLGAGRRTGSLTGDMCMRSFFQRTFPSANMPHLRVYVCVCLPYIWFARCVLCIQVSHKKKHGRPHNTCTLEI